MSLIENVSKRSIKKSGFLWAGLVLIIVLMIVFINIYQNNVNNGEGIFYTVFPNQMANVFVSEFKLWPFLVFGLGTCLVFWLNVTTTDSEETVAKGRIKAITGALLANVVLFLIFWACCWLSDQMNLSEGLFSAYGYMNFMTIIGGAVLAVIHCIIFAVCKILGNEIHEW